MPSQLAEQNIFNLVRKLMPSYVNIELNVHGLFTRH